MQVLVILTDLGFLRGFGLVLLQLVIAALIGGGLAIATASLILGYRWLAGSMIRFLRIGMWIPFVIYWSLPIWHSHKFDISQTFLSVYLASVLTVTLGSIHNYLGSRLIVGLKPQDALWWLGRTALSQALFISVFSQLWLDPYGWRWYKWDLRGAYAAFVLVILVVFAIECFFRTSFQHLAELRGQIITQELDSYAWSTFFGSVLIALLLMLVWQVLSLSDLATIFSSPPVVLEIGYNLFFQGTFWNDVYVSFSEVFGGLIAGLASALILYRILLSHNSLREPVSFVFRLLHIALFFSPIILMWWIREVGYWQKTLGIGLVTTYPMLQIFCGIHDRPPGFRLFLAIDDALPWAVVVMLFSEAMAATGGLGFSMVMNHAYTHTFHEGIAIALLTIALLVVFSSTLRLLATRPCFRT